MDTKKDSTKLAPDAVWDAIEECGIDQVYGIPGAVTVRLYNALYERQDKFNVVLVRHEQTASTMAEGYGRVTGKPAIVLGQGPFIATNGGEAIIEAYLSGTPMVILLDASINNFSQHGVYQSGTGDYGSYDLRQMMSGMTKYVAYATTPKETVQGVQLAYKHAISGRPGPTCVIIKDPSALGEVDLETAPKVYPSERYLNVSKTVAPKEEIEKAANLISEAKRPVIISGNGVHQSKTYDQLKKISEKMVAGVATSYRGKGTFSEAHTLGLGVMGLFPEPAANSLVADADLLLVVGCRLGPSDTANENPALIDPTRQKIVQIDIEPRNVGWTFPVDVGLVGDASLILDQLQDALDELPENIKTERTQYITTKKQENNYFTDPESNSSDFPIRPERLLEEINKIVEPNAIIALDAGNNRVWTTHYYQVKDPGIVLVPGGTAGMGWGPGAILGAKIAAPDRQCVSISGDGGFGLAIHSYITAVDENLPIVFIVMNDSALGMVTRGQGEKRIASEFRPTEYWKIAEAYGGTGYNITDPEQIKPALQKALSENRPSVLDIKIDPSIDYLKLRAVDLVSYQYRAI
ncbi:MAG: thiamine pyrophosphate-binding protein [Dehalococcoidia bacterium]